MPPCGIFQRLPVSGRSGPFSPQAHRASKGPSFHVFDFGETFG